MHHEGRDTPPTRLVGRLTPDTFRYEPSPKNEEGNRRTTSLTLGPLQCHHLMILTQAVGSPLGSNQVVIFLLSQFL